MRHIFQLIWLLTLLTGVGCERKAFPDDKVAFSDNYLNFLRPYKIGDTLFFENNAGQVEAFIITGKDSTIANTKGWFINRRPYKSISLSYNQIPARQWTHENISRDGNNNAIKTTYDDELILLNIYPDTGEESCHISFKNFRGDIESENDSILSKPIKVNKIKIDKYYKVDNIALDLIKSSTDIKTIYITTNLGISAYQAQNGNWWTRKIEP